MHFTGFCKILCIALTPSNPCRSFLCAIRPIRYNAPLRGCDQEKSVESGAMRILITGAKGGLGQALTEILTSSNPAVNGILHNSSAELPTLDLTDLDELDVTSYRAVLDYVTANPPVLVIHCAALTNVDRCAQEPDEALRANAVGTKNLALACQKVGAALCYISTNEVFDGESGSPYLEYAPQHPANPYGYSKWVGEQAVRELLPQHYIARTSWLFAHTGRNFLQRIVGLAREGKALSVVTDEVACPTYVPDLAAAIVQLVATGCYGTYHLVNEGYVSRYAFARHILDAYDLHDYPIRPITRAQYPRPSRPPAYSVLRNFFAAQLGVKLRPWQEALAAFVERERNTAS